MEATKQYIINVPISVEVEYDRQKDTLYIYFNRDEIPDEEWLSEDGDVVLGFKESKLVVIQIMRFSEKIEGYIL
ncbi:MAG: DUF2283 domain-containing protein [Desulfurococcaceae archaeon]|nr:DUF2283 domain-containing protein [Desulfurococcaceae archaeon]